MCEDDKQNFDLVYISRFVISLRCPKWHLIFFTANNKTRGYSLHDDGKASGGKIQAAAQLYTRRRVTKYILINEFLWMCVMYCHK